MIAVIKVSELDQLTSQYLLDVPKGYAYTDSIRDLLILQTAEIQSMFWEMCDAKDLIVASNKPKEIVITQLQDDVFRPYKVRLTANMLNRLKQTSEDGRMWDPVEGPLFTRFLDIKTKSATIKVSAEELKTLWLEADYCESYEIEDGALSYAALRKQIDKILKAEQAGA